MEMLIIFFVKFSIHHDEQRERTELFTYERTSTPLHPKYPAPAPNGTTSVWTKFVIDALESLIDLPDTREVVVG